MKISLGFLLLISILLCSCGGELSGGSETTNGKVVCTVVDQSGLPLQDVHCHLIPVGYNPINSSKIFALDSNKTNGNGICTLSVSETYTYNLQVVGTDSVLMAFEDSIALNSDTDTLISVKMQTSGSMAIINESYVLGSHIYLEGTQFFISVNDNDTLRFNYLPSGYLPKLIYYDGADSVIYDSVFIPINDTLTVEELAALETEYVSILSKSSSNNVTSLFQNSHGELIFGTVDGGIFLRRRNGGWHNYITEGQITSLLEVRSNRNIIVGTTKGPKRFNPFSGEFHWFTFDGLSLNDTVQSVEKGSKDNTYILLSDKVLCYNYSDTLKQVYPSVVQPTAYALDSTGGEWFGSKNGSLLLIDNGEEVSFKPTSLLNSSITFLEYYDGSIWVGTNAGLLSINNSVIANHTAKLPYENAKEGIIVGNSLYFLSSSNNLVKYSEGLFTVYSSQDLLSKSVVLKSLGSGNDNSLLIGSEGSGIFCISATDLSLL